MKVDFYEHTGQAAVKLTVTQTAKPPTAAITAPANGAQFSSGEAVNYSGKGTSAAGQALPGSALSWSPILRHCVAGSCHSHPLSTSTGASGSVPYPAHGLAAGECYFVQLTLTATDPATGGKGSATVDLYNRTQPVCP